MKHSTVGIAYEVFVLWPEELEVIDREGTLEIMQALGSAINERHIAMVATGAVHDQVTGSLVQLSFIFCDVVLADAARTIIERKIDEFIVRKRTGTEGPVTKARRAAQRAFLTGGGTVDLGRNVERDSPVAAANSSALHDEGQAERPPQADIREDSRTAGVDPDLASDFPS